MRQLLPKVAEERKRRVLRWVVHNFIKTSRPLASSSIAEESGLELSSATIRNVLKELEDEGFLQQPHTSAGRIPTDRGYRFYVDYLENAQRLASNEKASIEEQYGSRLSELDRLLSQTSKLLSHISHKTGLVLSPKIEKATIRRLELIALGGPRVLAIVVTQAGQIRHWPIKLSFVPSAKRVQRLNRFLNEHACGRSIGEIQSTLAAEIEGADRELRDLRTLADQLLGEIGGLVTPEDLYLDGATSLIEGAEDLGDLGEIQSTLRVLEERQALTELLQEEFDQRLKNGVDAEHSMVSVRIGEENALPELKNFSLVTTTYNKGDKVVGMLGILGPKRMEYPRMISLVEHISGMVSRTLESWETGLEDDDDL